MSKVIRGGVQGSWSDSNSRKKVTVNVPVLFFEEDKISYAFIPSLDLIGYGYSIEEAEVSLKTVLSEFLTYTVHKKTLFSELKRLGWKVRKAKKNFIAPTISDQISINDQLRDIIDNKEYRASQLSFNIPAHA